MKRAVLPVVIGLTALLSACATPTTPVRIPEMVFPAGEETAYVWSSGLGKWGDAFEIFVSRNDYATITRIDEIKVPASYGSSWVDAETRDTSPWDAWLLEIPTGSHELEIRYEGAFFMIPLEYVPIQFYREQSRQPLRLLARSNRVYAPFASDLCSRTWFWIEDWGPFAAGAETRRPVENVLPDWTKDVVAGERPRMGSCERMK